MSFRKKVVLVTGILAVFGGGLLIGANQYTKPKSVLHIITVKWKDGTTEAQKQAVMAATEKMASEVPGLNRIWLKTIKLQTQGYNNIIVMEFADEKAFAAYADHPAHKAWEAVYIPLRGESRTHDAGN
jgi:hypothetical protein